MPVPPQDLSALEDDGPGSAQVVRPPVDEAAFTAVYQEHYRTCLRLARRLVLDDGLAHEVVQEVFLSWWRTAGGSYCADRGALGAWLSTLTHHKAVDAVRTSERHRRLVRAAASALPCQPEERSVEDLVWWELGTQRLLGALTVLTPAQRDVLALAYVQGLTQTEIADQLGIPLGTVKSRTHSGMLRLRAAVGGAWTLTDPTSGPPRSTVRTTDADRQVDSASGSARSMESDVEQCAAALVRVAAQESEDEQHTATLLSQAMALADRHGEAGLYGLVVALARLAPADGAARRLA